MQPFSGELLTILVLVSIALAGLTFLIILITFIIFCYLKCRKPKTIKPIIADSTISIERHSTVISPLPMKNSNQYKKIEQQQQRYDYDTNSIMNEETYLNNNNNHKFQQQEYLREKNDETTRKNPYRMYEQNPYKRQQYQPIKPMSDIRIIERQTPYPPDVIARDKLMNNNRFSSDNKY